MNEPIKRRTFLQSTAVIASTTIASNVFAGQSENPKIKMFKDLGCGDIGVAANQEKTIEYAAKFGFGGVNPNEGELARMSLAQLKAIALSLKATKLQWGASGLPVDFRGGEDNFKKGLAALPKTADALKTVGVTRVSTWVLSGSDELTYFKNFEQHRLRLKACAEILKDRGLRLGLEFLGPKTLRNRFRFPFVCTSTEMLELCGAIGTGNVGLLLDAWHWHTSSGTVEELRSLSNDLIVNVHVNDAPKDVPLDQLIDNKRALPTTTSVIDLKGFINALAAIGYDGPVTCEPFDQELSDMDDEAALKKTIDALDALFGLIDA